MEVQKRTIETKLIYVGDFSYFGRDHFPVVEYSNKIISLAVECADVQTKKETILILKKDLMKVEACFQSTNSFFNLLLKQPLAAKIGFNKQDDNSFDTSKNSIRKSSRRLCDTSTS